MAASCFRRASAAPPIAECPRRAASFLARRSVNHSPLSPLTYLRRTASVFPDRTAIAYANWAERDPSQPAEYTQTWAETAARSARLASALARKGVKRGDTVAVLLPNTPAFVEAHHGINAAGALINPLNTRLDVGTLSYILGHSEAKVLLADASLAPMARAAIERLAAEGGRPPLLVDVVDPIPSHTTPGAELVGAMSYEALMAGGDPAFDALLPDDEWDSQAVNYTSGTTGRPKGVVYHHRGAALNALNNSVVWGMPQHPRYLWTLPMFHCNGWCFPYTVTMLAGTHVCLRSVDSASIFGAIASEGVTHLCGAPIVMNMMVHAPAEQHALLRQRDAALPQPRMLTAGAPPPAAVIQGMEGLGVDVTHVYGLTEVYGPAVSCPWNDAWGGLTAEGQAEMKARQGVKYPLLEDCAVVTMREPAPAAAAAAAPAESLDADGVPSNRALWQSSQPVARPRALPAGPGGLPAHWTHVPADGASLGEIVMRGNVVMKGYLKDEAATEAAFEGGWFHTGDLAVVHADGYVEIKDRAKDMVISGGENISTVEVEDALFRHPAVLEASVVARKCDTWGETPCAFVVLKEGHAWAPTTEADVIAHCREGLAHFKAPKHVIHLPEGLPKTSTGKVQKFVLRELAAERAAAEKA